MKNKILETLQAKVDESMDNIEAIQGVAFRNLLAHIMACSQTMRLANMVSQQYQDDKVIDALATQMAHVLAKSASMLAEAYDMSDAQLEELMKWTETLDGHVLNALKEANK